MDLIYSIYYNSSLYILTKKEFIENIPLPKLIIMYIVVYGSLLLLFIPGIYTIFTSKKFLPPAHLDINTILMSNEYKISGLFNVLGGASFLFPQYIFYLVPTHMILLSILWIYKKLMIR